MTPSRCVPVDAGPAHATDPPGIRGTEDGVHGGPLRRCGEGPDDMQIHRGRV